MDHLAGRVTAVMCDTNDLDASSAFWRSALGLDEVHRTETYVYLSPICAGGPHLAFQLVEEPRRVKNRLHMDVAVPDRDSFADWVVGEGGAVLGHVSEPGFPEWTVMADPFGNEFCIYEGRQSEN